LLLVVVPVEAVPLLVEAVVEPVVSLVALWLFRQQHILLPLEAEESHPVEQEDLVKIVSSMP
jgi:hypothetical protein